METMIVRSRDRWKAHRIHEAEYVQIVTGGAAVPQGMQVVDVGPGRRAIYVSTVDGVVPLPVDGWIVENTMGQCKVFSDADMEGRYEVDGTPGATPFQFDQGAFGGSV